MANSAKDILIRELKDELSAIRQIMSAQTAQIVSLQASLDAKDAREKELLEQISYLTKKLFGTSSEKHAVTMEGQLSLFDEAEQEYNPDVPEEEDNGTEEVHTRKKKASHRDTFKGIKVNRIVIPLSADQQICPVCGTQMEQIGEEYSYRELIYIPGRCEINEYYTQNYGCPNCKEGLGVTERPVIVKSKVPEALLKKSFASPSAAAWVIYQKYVNGLPLYRQEKDWAQYGARITRTTLANWIIKCADQYFQPLYDYFHRELLKRKFLMADETRVQVLKEPERRAESQSFMWLFRTGEDGLPTIILYGYTPTRAGDNAAEFLKGFTGYLETDGYQGYNKVPGVRRCSCWAHIRRYLIDAIPKGKQFDYTQPAVQGVQYCDRLFRIEDDINKRCKGDYEKRKQLRLEREKPILEAFWTWLDAQNPVKNSRMHKAVVYIKNRRDSADTYLEDGRCSFTNNLSENAIRPFTVGRKNWLFSDSVKGADASALAYTIVEMAKAHDLNVYQYIEYILTQRPDDNWTDEHMAQIAPWSEKLQSLKNRK